MFRVRIQFWIPYPGFSAVDIFGAINQEDDNKKSRNYWKYLKGKMVKDGIELVSVTNQFKFEAPDGKLRASDALDADMPRKKV